MTDHNQARTKVKNVEDITSELKKDNDLDDNKRTRLFVRILINSAKEFLTDKDFELSQKDKNFLKNQSSEIKKLFPSIIDKIIPGKTIAKNYIKKLNDKLNSSKQQDGEVTELVDDDGAMIGSNIPILNAGLHPRKTQDQTVITTRQTNNPVVRGYRVYYGESVENEKILDEVDMSDAFGYEETEDAPTYKNASKILKKMGIEDPEERKDRLETMGFDPKLDKQLQKEKEKGKCKNCFTKRRLYEKQREYMIKTIDEILLKKKKKSDDIVKKSDEDHDQTPIEKILKRNLESIKRIAEKEDIDINELIKILKVGE